MSDIEEVGRGSGEVGGGGVREHASGESNEIGDGGRAVTADATSTSSAAGKQCTRTNARGCSALQPAVADETKPGRPLTAHVDKDVPCTVRVRSER